MSVPTITLNDLLAVVSKLSTEQFTTFEAGIRAESERRREIIRSQVKAFWDIGDRVSFDAKTRGVKVGKLIKINDKTAKVQVEERDYMVPAEYGVKMRKVTWTVPLTILKRV